MYSKFSVYKNLLCGFLVIEVHVVSVICAGKFTCFFVSVICCVAQNHKTIKRSTQKGFLVVIIMRLSYMSN